MAGAREQLKPRYAQGFLLQFERAWTARADRALPQLGLLITPHMILSAPWFVLAATTATLLLVARPVACLLPFGFSLRETIFISWVGLRGAVPIFLVIVPMLAGITDAKFLFEPTFMVVVISLVAQGWTIAQLPGYSGFEGNPTHTGSLAGTRPNRLRSRVTTRFVQNRTLSRQGLEHRTNLA